MQEVYTGEFEKFNINGFEFDYLPCLHIQAFTVAEPYGDSV